jgi:hypothetical protein
MSTFIKLTKVGSMSRNYEGEVRIAVSEIARYEQPDPCYPTDVYLKGGSSLSVRESPETIDKMLERKP